MTATDGPAPSHHDPAGGFRNPWPTANLPGFREVMRWRREAARMQLPPDPDPAAIPTARPDPAVPHADAGELRATWLGHSSFLLQIGGLNLLADPQLSERASPLPFAGPKRFLPAALSVDALPPIDGVLLSHDHYDHLDAPTVRALHERFGERIHWLVPLGYRRWLGRRGIGGVTELDWWGATEIGGVRATCLPAQHWTSRSPFSRLKRLWCSWAVAGGGRSAYFGGDSGWFPGYPEIGERAGPFDLVLMPIGAYEPRWFMRSSHMNPEEAVRAYGELGGEGTFAGMHWGTFRLTDEDPLEPPVRTREAWRGAGLPEERLWIAALGGTRVVASRG